MSIYTPQTLFIGQQLIYLPSCSSTNAVAAELIVKNKATEGCVVITDWQTAGRGQRGSSWEAEPDKNITLSLILKPGFLSITQQFFLTISISLAVLETVQELTATTVKIKWPNDILAANKKLAGILIQNNVNGHFLQHSVVGIGLNVNQEIFEHPRATSLTLLSGKKYNRVAVTERLLEHLEKNYLCLKNGQWAHLKYRYLQHLFRYQETHLYELDGQKVVGQIVGVDEGGRLAMQVEATLRYFNAKEIVYLY